MSVDPKEKETMDKDMDKDNDDLQAKEDRGKYRIVLKCSFSSDSEG